MTIRVFLVEDMLPVHAVVSDLLASLGDFRLVNATATEAEAKLWLSENHGEWDLAIVDLVLEQGTGMAVIPKARASADERGTGNVVVFSDYASDGIHSHCRKLGADAVFLKSQVHDLMRYCSQLGGRPAAALA
ncbi:MAG TPA: hypothetical protein VNB23_10650 [Ramlibacter sp.]|nr:hypothetical protein [Ramlibacter sp.]